MGTHSVNDLKRGAKRRLPRMIFNFIEGGALDEVTSRRNESSFENRLLSQRVLRDISNIQTSTSAVGHSLAFPLMVAPMGMLALFHRDSDVAMARAAAKNGIVFVHSGWSGTPLDDVVAVAPGSVWAQIAFWNDKKLFEYHLGKIAEQGVETLVVSSDCVISSKRYRDLRHGLFPPQRPRLRDMMEAGLHPRWLWDRMTGPKLILANLPGVPGDGVSIVDRKSDWDALAELRKRWKGKIVLKAVMDADDAEAAIAAGMDGIIVSNHGGRQFDAQHATIDVLDEVVHRVNGRLEVFLDGGVRNGGDIAKAIALGARAVFAGRPLAYGLSAAGERGAEQAIEFLHDEFRTVMGFLGVKRVAAIDYNALASGQRPVRPYPTS